MNDSHFEALANERRRAVLLALLDHDSKRLPLDDARSADREYARAMYHRHLPKLEACGLIRWDRDAGEVARGAQFDDVEPLLETIVDQVEAC